VHTVDVEWFEVSDAMASGGIGGGIGTADIGTGELPRRELRW